jgi:hypothetical protein
MKSSALYDEIEDTENTMVTMKIDKAIMNLALYIYRGVKTFYILNFIFYKFKFISN